MYLSEKIQDLEKSLKDKNQDSFNKEILTFMKAVAMQIDLIQVKIDELSEQSENMTSNYQFINANMQTIKEAIVGDIKVETTDDYTEEYTDDSHNEDCNCDRCSHSDEDSEFVTLMCNYCEELFFIETAELTDKVECPFCKKEVTVDECRIDS